MHEVELSETTVAFSSPVEIAPGIAVVTVSHSIRNCHLILYQGKGLLINSVRGLDPAAFLDANFPVPEEIWHTQVDDASAAEGDFFPQAVIRIPVEFREVALASELYWKEAHTFWENPAEWSVTRGRERYGVAGSIILQPLSMPIPFFETFTRGTRLRWQELEFEVLDLSIRQLYSVGFALETEGKTTALFCGELVCGCGRLPDLHGFEMDYGGLRWDWIASTIESIAARKPEWLCPAFGPNCSQPTKMLESLISDLKVCSAVESPRKYQQPEPPQFGRYYDHGHGIYQITNYGNVILLVDPEGNGLMIDPGPCDYENPDRVECFREDLRLFEQEAGLRQIDLVLVTHFHGDHYDLWPSVVERYPDCRIAAWAPVAEILEYPSEFPYASQLPWYRAGWSSCKVDIRTTRARPLDWHGHAIHTLHLPGHCFAHAGYWMDWHGRRLAFIGDLIQVREEIDTLKIIPSNHWQPGEEGHDGAYAALRGLDISLNLSGHSIWFTNCDTIYSETLQQIAGEIEQVKRLVCSRYDGYIRPALQSAAARLRSIIAES